MNIPVLFYFTVAKTKLVDRLPQIWTVLLFEIEIRIGCVHVVELMTALKWPVENAKRLHNHFWCQFEVATNI